MYPLLTAVSMLDKVEYRAVIKFLHLQGKEARQIYDEMFAVYGNECPSYETVKLWKRQFRCGRTSLDDDQRGGRPSTSTTDDKVAQVEQLVLQNRRITMSELVVEVGISSGSVSSILHDDLNMSKVSARWVPRLLTPFQKEERRRCSAELLAMCSADENAFFDRLVTMDESWVYHFDPETKEMSKQWKHTFSPPPKKAKVRQSAGKVMLSVFWDCRGVILTDYLPAGRTITGDYYRKLLTELREKIKEKRRGMLSKGVLLLHDNAPAHSAHQTVQVANTCGYEILPHPPYSPDLAPSDFFLFREMKKPLRGRRFLDSNDVKMEVEGWFSSQNEGFYSRGLKQVKGRWEKCVNTGGGYVEKD